MTLRTLPDLEQGSSAWHDQRRGLVTASAVGKLLTATGKPADNLDSRALTCLLVAERITGYTDPTFTTDDMWRGISSEPLARDLYSEHYAKAVEVGFMTRDDYGFTIGYSPDGLVGDDGLIEVKAPRAKTHLRTILANEVPSQYMAQLQCGLLVSGRAWIDYVSYSAGMPMYVKRVLPNPAWQVSIVEAVSRFEEQAVLMTAAYQEAISSLVPTERIDYDLEVI